MSAWLYCTRCKAHGIRPIEPASHATASACQNCGAIVERERALQPSTDLQAKPAGFANLRTEPETGIPTLKKPL